MDFKILPNDIVLCAIAKNENDYIEEWVSWYFRMGFDKIYLFDDNESKDTLMQLPVISKAVSDGKMKIEYCGDKNVDYKQMVMYKKFYDSNSFAWCAFFDIDEFLVLKKHKRISDYLNMNRFKNFSAISICWEFYGDDGHIKKTDGGVMERFKTPVNPSVVDGCDIYSGGKVLVKKIIRGGIKGLRFPTPHSVRSLKHIKCCNDCGKMVSAAAYSIERSYELAKINHYFTKSTEEFVNKIKRGRAAQKNGVIRKLDEYFSVNPKTQDRVDALKHYYFGDMRIFEGCKTNKKVMILSMSCNKPDYIAEENVVRDTWAKEISNGDIESMRLFFYRSTDKKEAYIDKDVIYVPARDDWNGTYEKTVKCFKYVFDNFDFDYLVRTNTSNYINVECLSKMIDNIPDGEDNIYGARLIINGSSNGHIYFRGNCVVISRNTVKDIIDSFNPSIREADDGAISYELMKLWNNEGIDYHERLRQFPGFQVKQRDTSITYKYSSMKDVVCYRLKGQSSPFKRSSELISNFMRNLDNVIRSEKREFIAPEEFNKDIVEIIGGTISYEDGIRRSINKGLPKIQKPITPIKLEESSNDEGPREIEARKREMVLNNRETNSIVLNKPKNQDVSPTKVYRDHISSMLG